jgi:hypothetical protein
VVAGRGSTSVKIQCYGQPCFEGKETYVIGPHLKYPAKAELQQCNLRVGLRLDFAQRPNTVWTDQDEVLNARSHLLNHLSNQ